MNNKLAIIEIGSNNTKTHVYEDGKTIYDNNTTIEFKANYKKNNKIEDADLESLYKVIETAKEHTENIHIYGCSIFRNLSQEELDEINNTIDEKYGFKIEVVSQEDTLIMMALFAYLSAVAGLLNYYLLTTKR